MQVQYKNEQGSTVVTEDQIKGVLMVSVLNLILVHYIFAKFNTLFLFQSGASVEVKLHDKKETIEGTIVKIQDLSQYTVGK